jgi:putative transposase
MAELIKISIGRVFQFEASQVEVLATLSDGLCQVRSLSSGKIFIISVGELVPILNEREKKLTEEVSLWVDEKGTAGTRQRSKAVERFNEIQKVFTKTISNAEAVAELQTVLGLGQRSIYRLLSRYNEKRGPVSVMEARRGRCTGKVMLDEQVESIIGYCIKQTLEKKERFTYVNLHEKVRALCEMAGLKSPGIKAVTQRVKKLPATKTAKIRIGTKRAADESRPKPGSLDISRPFERVQIDHTPVDIILVDDEYRLPIGRPWVTFAIDLYTRIILGIYLSWSSPSRYSVACCIANMCIPKDRWLQQIGCADVKYPFYGVPEVIHADRAAEFRTPALVDACDAHAMKMEWRREKHHGGHIERYIGTAMGAVHFLPGKTDSNTVANRGYNSEVSACLTFSDFRHWLLREIERYHLRPHTGIGNATPKSKWDAYFTLPDGTRDVPSIISDPKSFKLDFMPRKSVAIRSAGIKLNNLRYWDDSLRLEIGNSYPCVYNPETLRTVWLKIDGHYRDIYYANVMAPDVSLEQAKCAAKLAKIRGIRPADEERYYEILRENEALVEDSAHKTKEARKKRSKQKQRSEHHFEAVPNDELLSAIGTKGSISTGVDSKPSRKVYFDD